MKMKWDKNGNQIMVKTYDFHRTLNGVAKKWYVNNQLKESGLYKNGKKIDVWKYWDEKGRLTKRVHYETE